MFHRIQSWTAGIVRRRRMERDMAEELELHLALRTQDLVRTGLSPQEARRRARLEFGAADRYKDECRESRGLRLADEFRADVLYAARGLRRSPGFAAVVVISLALGIGANTAMFSVVNGVLLRPLPYRDYHRLVSISEEMPASAWGLKNFHFLPPVNVLLHRDEFRSFEDILAMDRASYQLIDVEEPEGLEAQWVTTNMCTFLGVQPVLGRCFTPEDEADRARVALLSYGLWQRQFGGDPKILGRTVALKDYTGNVAITVTGVLPPEFRLSWKADLWLPLSESRNYRSRNNAWNPALTIARLRPGVGILQARAEIQAVQRRMYPERHEGAGGLEIKVIALADFLTQSVKPGLTVLLGVVGVVLLITCANVANLLLSRGAGRIREVAVRTSLGAGRLRICRQMLTEAVALAVMGGALGLLIAYWIVKGVKALALERFPPMDAIHMDWSVLGFTAAVSLLSGILFGLLPALRLSTVEIADAMKSGGAGAMGGRRHQRLMNGLVVLELALSVVAMMGAGLLMNTFIRLKSVDAGFRTDRILVASLNTPATNPEAATRMFGEILERVSSMPGVEAAGLASYAPADNVQSIREFRLPGSGIGSESAGPRANARIVSPGYFRVLGIPIARGRDFDRKDQSTSPRVVVISESVARRYWPDQDPLGKAIVFSERRKNVTAEIVGVARDVRQRGIRNQPDDVIYSTYAQTGEGYLTLLALTRGDPASMMVSVKREIRAVDKSQTFQRLTTMSQIMAREVAEPRFYLVLLAGYGALALLLTTVGVGGLVSYSVSRRTQEIGLRISFGATRSNLLRMFSTGTLRLAIAGLLLGIPSSLALTRLLRSLLFEVSPADPATLVAVAAVLTCVSVGACCAAAFRATRVEPGAVLRHE